MFKWEKENKIMKLYFTLFGQPYELVATLEKFDTEDWKYEIFLDNEIDFLPIEFFNSQQEAKKRVEERVCDYFKENAKYYQEIVEEIEENYN